MKEASEVRINICLLSRRSKEEFFQSNDLLKAVAFSRFVPGLRAGLWQLGK